MGVSQPYSFDVFPLFGLRVGLSINLLNGDLVFI
jgi:hypothetical protein